MCNCASCDVRETHRTQDLVAVKDNSHGCTLLVKVSDVWMVAVAAMLYRTRDQLPVSAQQWPPPTEHQSCRRHNIDMSFPHHFLLPANAASTLSQAKADTDPKIV